MVLIYMDTKYIEEEGKKVSKKLKNQSRWWFLNQLFWNIFYKPGIILFAGDII